jgi:hypothetical protein
MVLTGQREREVADRSWSEIDYDGAGWIIPETRMKRGAAHFVFLCTDALATLGASPRFAARGLRVHHNRRPEVSQWVQQSQGPNR